MMSQGVQRYVLLLRLLPRQRNERGATYNVVNHALGLKNPRRLFRLGNLPFKSALKRVDLTDATANISETAIWDAVTRVACSECDYGSGGDYVHHAVNGMPEVFRIHSPFPHCLFKCLMH